MLDKVLFWGGFAASARYAYKNFDSGFKKSFDYLGSAEWPRNFLTNLPAVQKTAEQLLAGEIIEDAVTIALRLKDAERSVAFAYLPPAIIHRRNATDVRATLAALLVRIESTALDAEIAVKPSSLGLRLNEAFLYENVKELLSEAWAHGKFIRLQVEDSTTTEQTIALYERLRDDGYENVGISIQAQLYRTTDDVERLIVRGADIRLSRGHYAEPEFEAYVDSAEIQENFQQLMRKLLGVEARRHGVKATIATYDQELVADTLAFVNERGIDKRTFAFELPYGIGHALKASLVAEGYNVRVYLPFGLNWYEYLMQRFGESPDNVAQFLGHVVPATEPPLLATPE